jgi:hypothetical protein
MSAEGKDPRVALFELYLATAEKVSDRRAQANTWMLSVNSAIVALYGYLQADKASVPSLQKPLWLVAIPAAGVIVCVAWTSLLTSYRKLNQAKFGVLQELEAGLSSVAPFRAEQDLYRRDNRISLSRVERWIPGCFLILYLFLFGVNFVR